MHKLKLRFPFTICHRFGSFRYQSVSYLCVGFGMPSICSASIKFAPLPTDGEASATVGSVNPPSLMYMAIINSNAIGAGRKSAGTLTYRRSRGRTIASQRIIENKSDTPAQRNQRFRFGVMGEVAARLKSWSDLAFERTKYGSRSNNFVKTNYPICLGELNNLLTNAPDTKIETFAQAFSFMISCEGIFTAKGNLMGVIAQASQGSEDYTATIMEGGIEDLEIIRYNVPMLETGEYGNPSVTSLRYSQFSTAGITHTVDSVTGFISLSTSVADVTSIAANSVVIDIVRSKGKVLTSNAYMLKS